MKYFRNGFMVGLLVFGLLIVSSATAQEGETAKSELDLTFEAINTDKKELYKANIELGGKGEQAFWSVYDQYEFAMNELNTTKVLLIAKYYNSILNNKLSGEKAVTLLKEYFSLEEERLKIKKSFIAKFQKVLADKKVARFFQLDNKVEAVINFNFARQIPLVITK